MTIDIKDWIESTLLEQDNTAFERLGPKREIFRVVHQAPLACLFIDPPPYAPAAWIPIPGTSIMDSFFKRLMPIVERHSCNWFFVSKPQDEYTVLRWVAPWSANTWNSSRLYAFENTSAEGGGQLLCLSFENRALLVFTLKSGFEIAYYGSEDLWEMISMALYNNSNSDMSEVLQRSISPSRTL
ncbi:MAG: hypothetical protein Q8Q59_10035 [Luteolibacter sp.]|jgi:hypothetical protein|nr:hypothetical protein [Luteolibacter sp.]